MLESTIMFEPARALAVAAAMMVLSCYTLLRYRPNRR